MSRIPRYAAVALIAVALAGCQFSPTAPFSGFDEQGSRVVGRFDAGQTIIPAQGGMLGATAPSASVEGIVVLCEERPSLKVVVDASGTFTLSGVPSGSFTLVFMRDGQRIGEIRFKHVRSNQGIQITVVLTPGGEVVLVDEERDRVSFSGECPRGAGFWCQNQGGKNPNLSRDEFEEFAEKAAGLLKTVPSLDTPEEVASAVCNTGNQFQRQLATLALNLAAETVKTDTSLQGEQAPYTNVRAAFDAAVAHLSGTSSLTHEQQQALKDVMDRINNAQNVTGCDQLPDDDTDVPEVEPVPPTEPPASEKITICHIPPGNFNARHTITIGASAWPSHQGHCAQGTCDSMGACR